MVLFLHITIVICAGFNMKSTGKGNGLVQRWQWTVLKLRSDLAGMARAKQPYSLRLMLNDGLIIPSCQPGYVFHRAFEAKHSTTLTGRTTTDALRLEHVSVLKQRWCEMHLCQWSSEMSCSTPTWIYHKFLHWPEVLTVMCSREVNMMWRWVNLHSKLHKLKEIWLL